MQENTLFIWQALRFLIENKLIINKYKKINKLEAVERLKDVRKKAAHSANFAHMIILACDKKLSTCGQVVDNA